MLLQDEEDSNKVEAHEERIMDMTFILKGGQGCIYGMGNHT
jgi:hypothetical protein